MSDMTNYERQYQAFGRAIEEILFPKKGMNMIAFKNEDSPGGWKLEPFIDESVNVIIRCPKCGMEGRLGTHKIADDGTVTPSVVCNSPDCKGSGFHDWIKLENWKPINNRFDHPLRKR